MCEIPKMRGINECYQYLLEQDPETQITKWRFRNLVNAGIIPSTRNGRERRIKDSKGSNRTQETKWKVWADPGHTVSTKRRLHERFKDF